MQVSEQSDNSYVLITPARNEEAYIEKTITSVISQHIPPAKWVIVSDGSTDRTDEIVMRYAQSCPFIEFIAVHSDGNRTFASKVEAFKAGYSRLRGLDYAYIGNLDADISFKPDYFEKILEEFKQNPHLGIAGGWIQEPRDGVFIERPANTTRSVPGAIQLFRRTCFEDIGGYIPVSKGGIDTVAEIKALMHDWLVESFPHSTVFHYRRTSAGKKTVLATRFRQGEIDYILGVNLLYQLMRLIYRFREKPYVIGSLARFCGYFRAFLNREKQVLPGSMVMDLRRRQLERVKDIFLKFVPFKNQSNAVCMIVFSHYPDDPRPRREAEALVQEGMPVEIICLRKGTQPQRETINGVRVNRLPISRRRSTKLRYLFEYTYFIIGSAIMLCILHAKNHYRIVHIHNMPDILVLSALIPRLLGSKLILDLHDPMPEVFMAKYRMNQNHLFIRLLLLMERFSIWFSDLVLTPNKSFRDLFVSRGCPAEKIHIIMNSPQESIFYTDQKDIAWGKKGDRDRFVIMYHGTIVERNGIGVALEAIAMLRDIIPNIVFEVYGEGDYVDQFLHLVSKLNLEDIVHYHGHVCAEEIVRAIECADMGLIPNKPSIHWDLAFPTRTFEYLCLKKPVIVPRTTGIMDYFSEDSIFFFPPGNAHGLCETILKIYHNPDMVTDVLNKGMAVYDKHRWELQGTYYRSLVRSMNGNPACAGKDIRAA